MQEQFSLFGYTDSGGVAANGRRVVYFAESDSFVKIGFTTRDLSDRMRELECGNPHGIKVIGTLLVQDESDERALHKRFSIFHHRKEWFRKTPELLAAINGLLRDQHRVTTAVRKCVVSRHDAGRELFAWVECPDCKTSMSVPFRLGDDIGWLLVNGPWTFGHVPCVECPAKIPLSIELEEE